MSIIHVGEIFRNPRKDRIEEAEVDGYRNIKNVTRGRHSTPADLGKGMPRFAELKNGPRRGSIPATWFHSKRDGKEYPDDAEVCVRRREKTLQRTEHGVETQGKEKRR